MPSTLTHLECSACAKQHSHTRLQNLCSCGNPLLARYDLRAASRTLTRAALAARPANMWRYAEVLPPPPYVSLGEGMTPLLHARRAGACIGLDKLFIKDEGLNPTGSFKARGLSAAVTVALNLGAQTLAIPTAGNAGGALAAYAANAGLRSVIVMPADTPAANVLECRAFGADVRKIPGLISDCGKYVAEHKSAEGWFDVSTLKEPYRIEGKKTMAYELFEQFNGKLPDVIIYPTGGGTGLVGMWKSFAEMEAMGWIDARRPRMVTVQAAGCAPIVRAFERGTPRAEFWENAETIAAGLRVPGAVGDALMLRALRESKGTAVAVSEDEILDGVKQLARNEGIFASPEGGAALAGLRQLAERGWVKPEERVVLFNTGSALKYLDVLDRDDAISP